MKGGGHVMQDDEIISLFFARSEDAIRQLDVQYGRTCRSLSHNILGSWQDAEECVNDAYLGAWNTIPPQKPSPLLAYICKIVRNLSLRRFRDKMAIKRNAHFDVALQELEGCLPSSDTLDDQIDAKELAAVIKQFLDSLSVENRVIFLRRYWFLDSYREIARRVGLTEKTVSVRLVRIRQKLKALLEEKDIPVSG